MFECVCMRGCRGPNVDSFKRREEEEEKVEKRHRVDLPKNQNINRGSIHVRQHQ